MIHERSVHRVDDDKAEMFEAAVDQLPQQMHIMDFAAFFMGVMHAFDTSSQTRIDVVTAMLGALAGEGLGTVIVFSSNADVDGPSEGDTTH